MPGPPIRAADIVAASAQWALGSRTSSADRRSGAGDCVDRGVCVRAWL